MTKSLSARIGRVLHQDLCFEYKLIRVNDIVVLLLFQEGDGDAIGLQVKYVLSWFEQCTLTHSTRTPEVG